ncbi:MAG: UDP-N-acetylmuramoyl-L-alanyl-D-glutamate--2,6-diaminopimelate ligase [Deltaproteobacteria bacterium]|nr:UDP-N-acetylmuramoyl-L-alanyl-D-glutamate--2,6-diaminopimelate ligase [Deltaproteobacteria bacterium]
MFLSQLAVHPMVREAWLLEENFSLQAVTAVSGQASPERAFYALKGFHSDGHDYVDQALQLGASVLFLSNAQVYQRLVHHPPQGVRGIFRVDEGRAPLGPIAAAVYGEPSRRLQVLGVTGTNGKTTVSHLTAQIMEAAGQPWAVVGGLGMKRGQERWNSERTTPEAPEIQAFLAHCLAQGDKGVAMEVSSIGVELDRTAGLWFKAAAYTNLTQDHLDFHHTMARYQAMKERLFLEYPLETAVLNLDDPVAAALVAPAAHRHRRVITFSTGAQGKLGAEQVRMGKTGMAGWLRYGEERVPFKSKLLGRHNLSNLLASLGLAMAAGLGFEEAVLASTHAVPPPGRLEPVDLGTEFLVLVDYAHTPDALEQVLMAARSACLGRLMVLFGCGGDRDRDKRPRMGEAAYRLADMVMLTSDNPRGEDPEAILDQIEGGIPLKQGDLGKRVFRVLDRGEAIDQWLSMAKPGDVVVLAGKGHETTQEAHGQKTPFHDATKALEWAKRNKER